MTGDDQAEPLDLDGKAAQFAADHGVFFLVRDPAADYPWSVALVSDPSRGWPGETAEEALDAAMEANHE